MKVVLKNKKSVTSILLFIFNILREYKNITSLSLSSLLEILQAFGKTESASRTGLSRMVKSGIFINKSIDGETVYKLTKVGMDYVNQSNNTIARFFIRNLKRYDAWDQNWHYLILEDFNKSDYENQSLLSEFQEFGLREMNCAWVSPYPISTELLTIIKKRKIRYMIFTGKFDDEKNNARILDTVFQIRDLEKQYEKFIHKLDDYKVIYKTRSGRDLVPVLFDIGWDFYNVASIDPSLPRELLEEWIGDKALKAMGELRNDLYRDVIEYLKELN